MPRPPLDPAKVRSEKIEFYVTKKWREIADSLAKKAGEDTLAAFLRRCVSEHFTEKFGKKLPDDFGAKSKNPAKPASASANRKKPGKAPAASKSSRGKSPAVAAV